MPGLYSHTSRSTGTTLTANIYNTDHQNHIDNQIPTMMDDYSADVTEMRTQTDPYPAGAESQATALSGELERMRYQIAQILGETYWYIDPDDNIASLNTRVTNLESAGIQVEGTAVLLAMQIFS